MKPLDISAKFPADTASKPISLREPEEMLLRVIRVAEILIRVQTKMSANPSNSSLLERDTVGNSARKTRR